MGDVVLSSNYSFRIVIDGVTDDGEFFYSVDGLSIEYVVMSKGQGGEREVVKATSTLETRPLIIKRPLSNTTTKFSQWCIDTLESGDFNPVSMNIFILNCDESINNHWIAEHAYPIGMKISPIDIQSKDPVIVEEIKVMYSSLKRVK